MSETLSWSKSILNRRIFDFIVIQFRMVTMKPLIVLFLFMVSISLGVETPIENPSMDEKDSAPKLIASKDYESQAPGGFGPVKMILRVKLYETSFKYPLLRTEERLVVDPARGKEESKELKEMVGDHFIVKLKKETDEKALQDFNQKQGTTIRKKMLSGDTYLIAFNGKDIEAFWKILSEYQKSLLFEVAEPDYVAHMMKKM
jgi:hypothetical protein